MAGKGKFTDSQLDKIAKHAAAGIIAELDGDKDEANAQYARARTVANTAKISNK